MSKLRSINTAIWNDVWFENLEPENKLLFIYLITNCKTNMLGVYEISLKKIAFETGLSIGMVSKGLKAFEKDNKIRYECDSVVLLNYLKHQNYNFNMKKSAIDCYNNLKEPLKIENQPFIERNEQGFETLCKGFGMVRKIEYEVEEETEEEYKEENKDFIDIFNFWNDQGIKNHNKMIDDKYFKDALKENTAEEIKQSIINYKTILDSDFYFNFTWGLADFLRKQKGKTEANFKRFLNDGDIYISFSSQKAKKTQTNKVYKNDNTKYHKLDLKI